MTHVWKEDIESKKVCKILADHANTLGDDPERLSTDFILAMCRGV